MMVAYAKAEACRKQSEYIDYNINNFTVYRSVGRSYTLGLISSLYSNIGLKLAKIKIEILKK